MLANCGFPEPSPETLQIEPRVTEAELTYDERIELQRKILLSKMETVTIESCDVQLITAALLSGCTMKAECGLIALKRTFNRVFVEKPASFTPANFRIEAEQRQRMTSEIIEAIKASMIS